MNILVLNSGSSSVKFSLFTALSDQAPTVLLEGQVSGIGTPSPQLDLGNSKHPTHASTPAEALHLIFDQLASQSFDAIGYRIVHPGPKLDRHQRITPQVLADLQAAIPFAPLHEPYSLALIRDSMARFPTLPHFACFDTVFHQTMPIEATLYPIPLHFYDQGVRRYGFHGLSCESVVRQLRARFGPAFPQRLIIAHLGSGCSVTALHDGKSVDTSMGLTPTGGVVMGTRPGDLDPGLIFFLLRQPGATVDSVESMLNHDSGLRALFGTNDMRKLREVSLRDADARRAIDIFLTSVRRTIAGMATIHGLDALVFTGGIGQHDPLTRLQLGNSLAGPSSEPEIDQTINESDRSGLRQISRDATDYAVFVVPAQEDLVIALHVQRLSASNG